MRESLAISGRMILRAIRRNWKSRVQQSGFRFMSPKKAQQVLAESFVARTGFLNERSAIFSSLCNGGTKEGVQIWPVVGCHDALRQLIPRTCKCWVL
jgi:hypothetical protein